MRELEVDVVTIGAGGAAYPAAFRLARAGRRVVMVDPKGVMSGNCLAEGCVPSKTIRQAASLARLARRADVRGLYGSLAADYGQILAYKDGVQALRYRQHARELQAAGARLSLIKGSASLIDPHVVEIKGDDGGQRIRAAHIILASGATVSLPPIEGAELCVTSHDFYAMHPTVQSLPASLVVIGVGYIGLETATMLNELGSSVHLLARGERVLRQTDEALARRLVELLDERVKLTFGAAVQRVKRARNGYTVTYVKDGREERIEAELVLAATGRPSVIPAGAEALGVAVDNGHIVVNGALQTSLPHIYAPGDVNGRSMLFHSAVRQSLVAASNIMAGDKPVDFMDFDAVPTTVFTFPEIAYVGVTPTLAAARGLRLVETAFNLADDARAQIEDEARGEIREFFDERSMRLVGAWVAGGEADYLIGELAAAVARRAHVHELAALADQHPTSAECISKAARALL
ncbi:MAG: dihydrolipoyl dehydrogenase [Thermoleophilia bacterium]